MQVGNQQITEPWYRNFWVWLLISIPVLTILGCALTIFLAVSNPDYPVHDHSPNVAPALETG